MARQDKRAVRYGSGRTGTSPLTTSVDTPDIASYEGGPSYSRSPQSELFVLAVSSFYGENTFYERPQERERRFSELVETCAVEQPVWTAAFIRWLRSEAN